jgi:hypothetical protein
VRSFADKEHSGRYLSSMSDGSLRVGWAVDEFDSPNDPCGGSTVATEAENSMVSLTGTKIVKGDSPTAFAVYCNITRAQGKQGHGWIMVERSTANAVLDGGVLKLNGALVPVDNIFVPAGDGYRAAMTALLTAQYLIAASVSRTAAAYATEDLPASLVMDQAHSYALEACGAALAANIEKGVQDTFLESTLTSVLIARVMAAKRLISSEAELVGLERMLSSGDDYGKAAACCGIEDFAVIFNQTTTMTTMQTRTMRSLGMIERFPPLDTLEPSVVDRCEKLIVKFGEFVERLAIRSGLTVIDRELQLERAATAAALLFATASVFSRAHRAAKGKTATAVTEKALASVWGTYALDEVEAILRAAGSSSATADSAHARVAASLLSK